MNKVVNVVLAIAFLSYGSLASTFAYKLFAAADEFREHKIVADAQDEEDWSIANQLAAEPGLPVVD